MDLLSESSMSISFYALRTLSASLVACASVATALAGVAGTDLQADPRVEIAKKVPGARPEEFTLSPIPGIYELQHHGDFGYVTSDGHYFFGGDLYDMQTKINLTDTRRTDMRRKLLAAAPENEMVIFGPANAKYTLTVFTDVDCGYCRKLHSEIKEINRLGIRVRYMFYPRSGPGTDSWRTAEAVWCSPDRKEALTRAKLGESIKANHCGTTPVAREYELGQTLGIRGTPGIFTSNGDYLAGYMPPGQLLAQLKTLETKDSSAN
jgi:thiol:disulfide interchange protein DsbC